MSRLVVHIGFDKTGTTSIQRFLREHQRPLSNMGLVYPLPGFSNYPYQALNHEVLTSLLSGVKVPSGTLNRYGSHDNAAHAAQRWARAVKQLNLSRPSTLIISSEAFYSLPAPAVKELRYLSRWLTSTESFEDGVQILAYVAEPASRYRRAASQSILTGRKIPRPCDQAARNYIGRYIQWFGRKHVEVKAYDRNTLVNGNAVDDFLDFLRPRLWENASLKKDAIDENRSPSSEALLLCSVMRQLGLLDTKQWKAFVLEVILFDRAAGGRRTAALRADVHDYLFGSSPDYDWLQAEFGCVFGQAGTRRHATGYQPHRQLSMLDIFQVDLDKYRHLAAYFRQRSLVLRECKAGDVDLAENSLISAPCILD